MAMDFRSYMTREPTIWGGEPVITGTRATVDENLPTEIAPACLGMVMMCKLFPFRVKRP